VKLKGKRELATTRRARCPDEKLGVSFWKDKRHAVGAVRFGTALLNL
jgi:hypothetical protein